VRITIVAPGSQGDVRPYVALGAGLQADGHRVRVATHADFAGLVSGQGLAFHALAGNLETLMRDRQVGSALAGGNPLSQLMLMRSKIISLVEGWIRDCRDACREADLVMGGLGGVIAGQPVAEKLGIPFVQAWLVPFTPTRAYPAASFSAIGGWLGGRLNRLSHIVGWQWLAWPIHRAAVNRARRAMLGLPPAPFWNGPLEMLERTGAPVLYGFSSHVIPRPPDWDTRIHITGYWFLDSPAGWQPPSDLVDFLQAGPPPVYVGFGSMSHGDPEAASRLVLQALEMAGQRGILLSGWGGLSRVELPDSVFMVGAVPHSWLFPQVAAAVHHGGAGTTAAGLRAGTPTVVVPFISLDQAFWGRRVAALGAGVRPIPAARLTAETLAGAIATAVGDPAMGRTAAELGARIRAEDGVAAAVAVIRNLFSE